MAVQVPGVDRAFRGDPNPGLAGKIRRRQRRTAAADDGRNLLWYQLETKGEIPSFLSLLFYFKKDIYIEYKMEREGQ